MKIRGTTEVSERLSGISVFALFVLVFSVTRGLVPLIAQSESVASPTYYFATALGIVLSAFGLFEALFRSSNAIGKWPRRLLIANLLLHIYWVAPLALLRPNFEVFAGLVYTGILPFSVYALIRIPQRVLVSALGALTVVVAGFVIYEFIQLNTLLISDGASKAYERQRLLRADFLHFTRGGALAYRAPGLLPAINPVGGALPHDSACMLAMLMTFWFAIVFQPNTRKLLVSMLALSTLVALLFTQSATNIFASIVGVLFVLAMHFRGASSSSSSILVPILVILTTATITLLGMIYFDFDLTALTDWTLRVGSEGDWEGITRVIIENPWLDLFVVLFGHGQTFDLSRLTVEIGIARMLMEFGLVHWIILMSLLLYPVMRFSSRNMKAYRHRAVPYVAAVFVGVLSLWHYGSLIKATNIFVFFALYAAALRFLVTPQDISQPAADRNTSSAKPQLRGV